jgi:hypothetical protein
MALPHTRYIWGRDPPFSPRRDATKPPSYREIRLAARKNPKPDVIAQSGALKLRMRPEGKS